MREPGFILRSVGWQSVLAVFSITFRSVFYRWKNSVHEASWSIWKNRAPMSRLVPPLCCHPLQSDTAPWGQWEQVTPVLSDKAKVKLIAKPFLFVCLTTKTTIKKIQVSWDVWFPWSQWESQNFWISYFKLISLKFLFNWSYPSEM